MPPLSGFLAAPAGVPARARTPERATRTRHGDIELVRWGLEPVAAGPVLALSRLRWDAAGPVADGDLAAGAVAPGALAARMLPPFAILTGDGDGVTVAADAAGFRQLYHGDAAPVISTSALLAGWTTQAGLDRRAVAVQSQLGWQLGQRTMFDGISKLTPGATARLDAAGVAVAAPDDVPPRALSADEGVGLAAAALTATMERLLDEHPDVILQLSGGWDSRILLSAVPPSRRRGLRAMTLGAPDDGDVRIARVLAERCGLDHEVRPSVDASRLSPEQAWRRVRRAALQVDAHTDALALAALALAEEQFDQGARISGVGGEVGRGFYYSSRVRDRPYDRDDARRLAMWRMFPNHAVEPGMLVADFARWAQDVAVDEVYAALRRGGDEWFRATDRLYLRNRVQRWAGTNDTAVGDDRLVVNPMLSAAFLAAVEGVPPAEKAHARFFGRLQMRLDADLGTVPLEGRPAPVVHVAPSALGAARRARTVAGKGARKVIQRVRGGNRPAEGTDVLSELVVRHWRSHDALVAASPALREVVDPVWMDRVLSGALAPRPSSVALATALIVVADHAVLD